MKTYRHELIFTLPARRGFVNITSKVQECVTESRVKEGLVLVNSMHISSSIFINDNESGLLRGLGTLAGKARAGKAAQPVPP